MALAVNWRGFKGRRAAPFTGRRTSLSERMSCCGMAGAFVLEEDKHEVSIARRERVLLPAVRAADAESDGISCCEQIAPTTGREALHLADALQLAPSEGGPTDEIGAIGDNCETSEDGPRRLRGVPKTRRPARAHEIAWR
jgi:hypothetical protein